MQDSRTNTDHAQRTILLVDDETVLRDPLRRILERAGFLILVADDGQEALRIAGEYPDRIDLLISDVQMRGMSGPDLAMALGRIRPGLRVLVISSYPKEVVTLDRTWWFLRKPFTSSALLREVQEILSNTS